MKRLLAIAVTLLTMTGIMAQGDPVGCSAIGQLPFEYGFEDEAAGQTADASSRFAADCWTIFNRHTDNEPFVSTGRGLNNVMPHDGLNALSGYCTAPSATVLVLPEFEMQIDSLLFGIWVSRDTVWNEGRQDYDTASGVELGYLADANDPTSFVVVATCIPDEVLVWEYFQTDLPVGADGRLAIRYIVSDAIAGVFIDDITVSSLADAPRELSIISYGCDTATFVWQSSYMETAWLLEYTAVATNTVNTVEVLSKPCTITGLTPLTHYRVRVAAIDGDGIRSLWSQPVEFTTFETNVSVKGVDGSELARLFPNPAQDMVTVVAEVGAKVLLYDLNGRQILASCMASDGMTIDISSLPNGTYVVRVVSQSGVTVQKLIVG